MLPRPLRDDPGPPPAPLAPRPRRPLVAGGAVGVVVGAYLWAWWWSSDVHTCDHSGVLGCIGPVVVVLVVGTPVALGLLFVALRLAGAGSGLLGCVAVGLVTWVSVLVGEPLDPPVWSWAVVAGAVASIYVGVEGRLGDRHDSR